MFNLFLGMRLAFLFMLAVLASGCCCCCDVPKYLTVNTLAYETGNISACYGLDEGFFRENCCDGVGMLLNASLCEMALDDACRDSCFTALADESGNINFCREVREDFNKKWCYSRLNQTGG